MIKWWFPNKAHAKTHNRNLPPASTKTSRATSRRPLGAPMSRTVWPGTISARSASSPPMSILEPSCKHYSICRVVRRPTNLYSSCSSSKPPSIATRVLTWTLPPIARSIWTTGVTWMQMRGKTPSCWLKELNNYLVLRRILPRLVSAWA